MCSSDLMGVLTTPIRRGVSAAADWAEGAYGYVFRYGEMEQELKNMMDIVKERGMELDLPRLSELLGIPCIAISARERTGLNMLLYAMSRYEEYGNPAMPAKRERVSLRLRDRQDAGKQRNRLSEKWNPTFERGMKSASLAGVSYDWIEEIISQVVKETENHTLLMSGQMTESENHAALIPRQVTERDRKSVV